MRLRADPDFVTGYSKFFKRSFLPIPIAKNHQKSFLIPIIFFTERTEKASKEM